jgi:hypothetical protein
MNGSFKNWVWSKAHLFVALALHHTFLVELVGLLFCMVWSPGFSREVGHA